LARNKESRTDQELRREICHIDPKVKECHKKFRATNEAWQFLDRLPNDSRGGFELLIGFLIANSEGKDWS
jgi:hypothetical protein